MSEQIFDSANKSNTDSISFQDFEAWAGAKSHESEVLFGLFGDFSISEEGQGTMKVASTPADYENSDNFL